MSNQLKTFEFNKTTAIRTAVASDNNVWFVAKDLAEALEYDQTANALKICKQSSSMDELNKINSLSPATKWIPESDVYRLIMRSNKAEAEKFQDWVVEEVLPSIRKTGSYSVQPTPNHKAVKPSLVVISKETKAGLALAKLFGLSGNQAYLHADEAVQKTIGQSPIKLLGIELSAPAQERHFNVTTLAEMTGFKSAIALNNELAAKGFQVKVGKVWTPTEKGKPFAVLLDKNKAHTHGTVQQLEWRESIKHELSKTNARGIAHA